MELSKTVPAVLVVLSLFVFPGCSSDSFNAMHPRGLITAHSLRNARQKQDFTLPAPVSISSGILRIQESRGGSNRAETGRRFGRQMEIEDGVPVVEGVRVPDDPREKNIVYRNARIINNVLVTDNGETPELSHQVTQSVTVNKKPSVLTSGYTVSSHPINTVSSNAINSLSSLAKLVLSSSVKSALDARDKEKPTKYNNAKYVSTFRTPPPLRSYVAKSAPSGRSFNSHPAGFTARHHPTSESRFIPISRSHSPSFRDTTQESFWNNIHQLEPQYRVRTYNGYASRIGSLADKVSRSEVLTNRKRYTHTSDKKNIYPLKKNETYENVGRIVPRKPFDENKVLFQSVVTPSRYQRALDTSYSFNAHNPASHFPVWSRQKVY